MKETKILFLAHYAPQSAAESVPDDIEDPVYAEYHNRIYSILYTEFGNQLISSNDINIITSRHEEIDFVFSLYNRMPFRNSEIFVSALCEYLHIPYLGASPNIRALAEDKHLAKMMAAYANVPTPEWISYNVGDSTFEQKFTGPYFIKPRFGASSKHIDETCIAQDWNAAIDKIKEFLSNEIDVIVEKQIKGVYYTSPVLLNFGKPIYLPLIKQISDLKDNVVTYHQKRKIHSGLQRTLNRDESVEKQIHYYSSKMFDLVQPLDYTRFDYIVDNETGIPYFLELNVCCNLGEHSTISQAAKSVNIEYSPLVLNILYSSLNRNKLFNNIAAYQF